MPQLWHAGTLLLSDCSSESSDTENSEEEFYVGSIVTDNSIENFVDNIMTQE